jgi:hypothetical protein
VITCFAKEKFLEHLDAAEIVQLDLGLELDDLQDLETVSEQTRL